MDFFGGINSAYTIACGNKKDLFFFRFGESLHGVVSETTHCHNAHLLQTLLAQQSQTIVNRETTNNLQLQETRNITCTKF